MRFLRRNIEAAEKLPIIENMKSEYRYVALLRGINISGHKAIKMESLRAVLSSSDIGPGYEDVVTVLATGNIAFTSTEQTQSKLEDEIHQLIESQFGHSVPVIVIPQDLLMDILLKIQIPEEPHEIKTKIYVSFFDVPVNRHPTFPPVSEELKMRILETGARHIAAVVPISKNGDTLRYMEILDRLYGKKITTRTISTLKKIAEK